jgi:ABC-type oligopeptide transport system ATPase subunit
MDAAIDALLLDVGLGAQFRNRFSHELSGGQRQRGKHYKSSGEVDRC